MSAKQDAAFTDRPADSPTAWFAVLERARLTDDYDLASKAQRELERLGVVVKFRRPQDLRGGKGVEHE